MMEVNQPIGTVALEMQKLNSTASVSNDNGAHDLPDSLLDAKAKQNGISDKTTCAEVSMDLDESKELHDGDSMERLNYSETEDEDIIMTAEVGAQNGELVDSISDSTDLLEKATVPDRLPEDDPSDVTLSLEDTDTKQLNNSSINSVASVGEDDTLTELSAAVTAEVGEEIDENLLLDGEDTEVGDEPEVDENLLLEDAEMEEAEIQQNAQGDDVAMQDSVIQIEDSVVGNEKTEDDTASITDNSVIAVDESCLSILNTAAVDIADMTVDESVRIVDEKDQSEVVTQEKQSEPSAVIEKNKEPVPEMEEETVVSKRLLGVATEDEPISTCSSPELNDLIKFPDDKVTGNSDQAKASENDSCIAEANGSVSEESVLGKLQTESLTTEDSTLLGADDDMSDETSDLIKLNSAATTSAEGTNSEDVDPELSDLIKFPDDTVSEKQDSEKVSESKESADEEMPTADQSEAKCTSDEPSAEENNISEGEKEKTIEPPSESVEQQPVETSRQALQAADEEDLLEMMEEPERMEPDDDDEDNVDDDLDEHSSESGSAKQTQAEEDEDFEESDYTGLLEDDVSANAEDNETEDNEASSVQIDEEELAVKPPPSKRKCSVDIRESVEAKEPSESVSEKEVELAKLTEQAEESDEKLKDVVEVSEKSSDVEKVVEVEKETATLSTSTAAEKLENQAEVSDSNETQTKEISEEESPKIDQEAKENETVSQTVDSDSKKQENSDEQDQESNDASEKQVPSDKQNIPGQETVSSFKENIAAKIKSLMQVESKDSTATLDEETKVATDDAASDKPESATDIEQKPVISSTAEQDEVLVIDDDDEVPEKAEQSLKTEQKTTEDGPVKDEKDASLTITGKRPCPEGKPDEKEEKTDCVKKMRLSEEDSKSEKLKDVPEVPKVEKKSALDSMEPITIVLDPAPTEPSKEKKPIKLDFLDKFKKPLEKMDRTDLEEFVLQKIVEGIAFKSAISEMRTQLDSQDVLLQGYRQKVHDLNKQFKDLEMVHERVVKDLEKKNQHFITPVKITRAVGLQVSQPRFVAGNRASTGNSTPISSSPKATRSQAETTTPASSPNRDAPQVNIQNRRTPMSRAPSVVIRTKTPAGPNTNRPNQLPTGITKISPINSSPATPNAANKNVSAIQTNLVNTSSPQQQQQQQPSTTASTTSTPTGIVPPITRKRPLQKFTPMRPPLSITQQVQQQQQTRQMQEILVRQQIQEVQTNAVGTSGPGTPGSQPQSPLTQSPQGSPLTRTPEPSPLGISPARVPPIVMKKVGQPPKGTPATMQIINRQTPSMVSSVPSANIRTIAATASAVPTPPAPVIDNSLIDLTDEDDTPKPANTVVPIASTASVVPKPPITILNGQQTQYVQRQNSSMPPLVVINQQRIRATLQQRPMANGTVNAVGSRPMLIQRPGTAANGFPRTIASQQMYKPRMPNGQIAPRRIVSRATIRQQTTVSTTSFTHPAPLPQPGAQAHNPSWKQAPPRPSIRINNIETGIVISWTMDDLSENHATIVSYQIYAYQETSAAPSMDMWRHVGDVKAMLLPMAVTLTQFQEGQRYHFAVRAVDEHQRVGQFSPPRTWNESTPAKA
ncbi:mucin-17 isoform X2 [Sabethes cyaneus]|uniref:mucin-17 isoform X2 n=1 Tax=Sabethes cyaneus TaxID=53552 RepID=UPI00237DDE04|nr:mucin-17 isoform X2 [Sabethes cyaneus]